MSALALVLGVAVAVSSVVLAGTIDRGATTAAWQQSGGDLRVSGPRLVPDTLSALRETPGVAAAAPVATSPGASITHDSRTTPNVMVVVVDDDLERVQAANDHVEPLPAELFATGRPVTPVILGGLSVPVGSTATVTGLGQVEVVGTAPEAGVPGVRTPRYSLVVSASNWEAAGQQVPLAALALVATAPQADPLEVSEAVLQRVPNAVVESAETALASFRAAPVSAGMNQVFLAASIVTLGLTLLAVVLVQLMGAPARVRLLSVLRTIGIDHRQSRAIATWELAPLVVAAVLTGAVAGAAIPWLMIRAVDLTGLTGGATQPSLFVDPLTVGGTLAGLIVIILIAITLASARASRADLAQQLRIGEER